MTTTNLGLPIINGNMTADVVRDLNALAEAVDGKVGATGGLAKHDDLTAHQAETVSEGLYVTRDATITGVQTITLINNKVPKSIDINSTVLASKKFSIGKWAQSGSSPQFNLFMRGDGFTGTETVITSIWDDATNKTNGAIQNVRNGAFDINWGKVGVGGTGTIVLLINVRYHD